MKVKTKRLHALQKQITRLNRRMERLKRLSNRFSWYRLISKEQLESKKLVNWLHQQSDQRSIKRILRVSTGLAVVNIVLFVLNMANLLPPYWLLSLTIYFIIYFMYKEMGDSLLDDFDLISDELQKFKVVLLYLERYPYRQNESLSNLCQPFLNRQKCPSARLKSLKPKFCISHKDTKTQGSNF